MNLHNKIEEYMKANGNIITTSQIESIGFTRALLSKYEKNGLLERVRQGIYITPDLIHDDMYTMMLCSSKIIFSHESALFLNGLSERTPFIHNLTIPSNACLTSTIKDECICYYINPKLYELGLVERKTTLGNIVRCYNAERTICDLIRSRSRIDNETIISAIKKYVNSNDKDLHLLYEYAKVFKVSSIIKNYLEVLL